MPSYAGSQIRELRTQLLYAPRGVRSRHLRGLEELLAEIDPTLDYPRAYVSLRITGFEGESAPNGALPD